MEINKLQQLLSEMSLQEKIGQMVQLTGVYFEIYGTASSSYPTTLYGRCDPWM